MVLPFPHGVVTVAALTMLSPVRVPKSLYLSTINVLSPTPSTVTMTLLPITLLRPLLIIPGTLPCLAQVILNSYLAPSTSPHLVLSAVQEVCRPLLLLQTLLLVLCLLFKRMRLTFHLS